MASVPDWAIPIAVFLILMASQLFWLRRFISFGEGRIHSRWGCAGLKAAVGAACLFYFVCLLVPWRRITRNSPHASTTLTLPTILVEMPFWWWFVGSLAASALVMTYRTARSTARGATWLYRRVRQVAAGHIVGPSRSAFAPDPPSPARRRFLERTAAGVLAAPFVAAGYGLLYGRLDFEVTRLRIRLARLSRAFEGFRIIQLSDFHISPFMTGGQIRRCVTIANGLKPDLVALTGDFLTYDPGAQSEVVQALAGLRAPYGVFGCLGNHEYLTKTEESITRFLAGRGIRILRQERVLIESHDERMNLMGVDYQEKRFGTDHSGHLVDQYLEGSDNLVMPGIVNILLDHNPNAFDRAAELGIDLMLAGHTHGGQLSLELIHRGLSLARTETPYVSGWYEKAGSQLYVNRGIGTTGPPIRLGATPEITVLELVRDV